MKSIFLIVCGVAILSVLPACESEHRVTTTTTTTEETTVPVATTETHTVRSY